MILYILLIIYYCYGNPYEILGVGRLSNHQEITNAYKKLIKHWDPKNHPKNRNEALEMTREIDHAYNSLVKELDRHSAPYSSTIINDAMHLKSSYNSIYKKITFAWNENAKSMFESPFEFWIDLIRNLHQIEYDMDHLKMLLPKDAEINLIKDKNVQIFWHVKNDLEPLLIELKQVFGMQSIYFDNTLSVGMLKLGSDLDCFIEHYPFVSSRFTLDQENPEFSFYFDPSFNPISTISKLDFYNWLFGIQINSKLDNLFYSSLNHKKRQEDLEIHEKVNDFDFQLLPFELSDIE